MRTRAGSRGNVLTEMALQWHVVNRTLLAHCGVVSSRVVLDRVSTGRVDIACRRHRFVVRAPRQTRLSQLLKQRGRGNRVRSWTGVVSHAKCRATCGGQVVRQRWVRDSAVVGGQPARVRQLILVRCVLAADHRAVWLVLHPDPDDVRVRRSRGDRATGTRWLCRRFRRSWGDRSLRSRWGRGRRSAGRSQHGTRRGGRWRRGSCSPRWSRQT